MRRYEVFLKKDGRDEYRHAGSLDAPDDELALVLARESYLRRAEGDRLWLVDRQHLVTAGTEFVAPNADKPHRHNDGERIAERRRLLREKGPQGEDERGEGSA
ncbi:MAG: 1,2-phenylacetyl-CoA epoxidase subunit B [Actinomycetota bacterium]|nr:1,2-phenylacetyl-CoA epoxidase subunit B [Actinomycetota bacterium]MEC9394417.1 1,2-phenylacetyl-CoA epoxidase subunit B [Actinomycetota bacterium]MED6327503.1 1,2-phenylacetyl-CoA epoxidase subunit B [Actinomycetota bacterium]MEE2959055.1 1,2-phenylacetyl-CoA epoxidase subunit B [Actinomycetota bacterium]